mgnify:CR=1 FL=1
MSALLFYRKYDKATLISLSASLDADPANQNDASLGSIHRLTPTARKKSEAIAQAIAWHMADERKTSGCPVPVAGYSGRQSNRR